MLLSLWITGAGCMFGCGEVSATTSSTSAKSEAEGFATVVSGDACASQGSHDCCAKKKAATKQSKPVQSSAKPSLQTATLIALSQSVIPDRSRGMSECPLAMSRAVTVTKASDRKELVATIALLDNPVAALTSPVFDSAVPPAARLPNRSQTYLRCCAFLI